jgi:putative RNA 2'-phosphotransferase
MMLTEKEVTRMSKFLSLVLRHKPETIGLTLDENGWANTENLIQKMTQNGFEISPDILAHIVETNNKQRFSFNSDKTSIRANQGHSILVDVELKEQTPPEYLYHGTAEKNVSSILNSGIEKGTRQHVHLSIDKETAVKVGQRHGKPKVLLVSANKMSADGFRFYLSENKVWLTDNVPPEYLKLLDH